MNPQFRHRNSNSISFRGQPFVSLPMHKLTSLLHKISKPKDSHSAGSPLQSNLTCCEQDLYRYRKQRGVNLGISRIFANTTLHTNQLYLTC